MRRLVFVALVTAVSILTLGAMPAAACGSYGYSSYGYGGCGCYGARVSYSYGAPIRYAYGAPMNYARYAYADDDDDYGGYYGYGGYGGYYGYGGRGLAVGAGIARRAYWRNGWDNRGRGYVADRAAFRGGSIGRIGGHRARGRRTHWRPPLAIQAR